VSILLGPGVNLSRIVQNGRNFEYLLDDPFLASQRAVSMINGLQGEGIVATVKHFVANNHEALFIGLGWNSGPVRRIIGRGSANLEREIPDKLRLPISNYFVRNSANLA